MLYYNLYTLASLIAVGVRLLILKLFCPPLLLIDTLHLLDFGHCKPFLILKFLKTDYEQVF